MQGFHVRRKAAGSSRDISGVQVFPELFRESHRSNLIPYLRLDITMSSLSLNFKVHLHFVFILEINKIYSIKFLLLYFRYFTLLF